jgi:carboxymethylenebutenolidase
MKTLAALLAGAVIGVAATQVPRLVAAADSAPAAASSPPADTGNVVHPISKNIVDRLTKSTRHMDVAHIKDGNRVVETLVYYPMDKNKAMAVVLVHEIFGLSDWVRAAADQLAEAGYIVLVPDLLSGMGPHQGGTDDFPVSEVTRAIGNLPPDQVMADLTAVVDYAKKLDACNGNLAIAGFCWGGGKAFAFSTVNKDIKAAFVFYGAPMLPASAMPKVNVPVYGFYGSMDRNLGPAVPGEAVAMKAAGKTYDAVVYDGAQHGFMRLGQMDAPPPTASDSVKSTFAANKKAADESWARWLALLKKIDSPAPTPPAADAKPAASPAK